MKALNITFSDEEWEKLVKAKGKKTWREFVLKKTNGT